VFSITRNGGLPLPVGDMMLAVAHEFRTCRQAISFPILPGHPVHRSHRRLSMMNALPALIIAWAVLTGLFLALLAYNGTLSRYEENHLFLDNVNANERQQSSILRKISKVTPYIRAFGTLSALMTVAIVAIYTFDAWKKIHE
jgi:hypothetical protein